MRQISMACQRKERSSEHLFLLLAKSFGIFTKARDAAVA